MLLHYVPCTVDVTVIQKESLIVDKVYELAYECFILFDYV